VVSVKDTGIVIKKEDLHKLFEQFSQIESISDRRVGGTGLGLAISKKIVDAHNGRIWVDSAPGKGSTFSFSLPLKGG
jgi:two-component system sensor histidine kinase VicK